MKKRTNRITDLKNRWPQEPMNDNPDTLKSQKFCIENLEELRAWIGHFIQSLDSKSCILLSGSMGAGKTQFVRYFVECLGNYEASSPTFAIHHTYLTKSHTVDHIDLYRLEDESELEATGFWDLFEKDEGYILIEWANRIDKRFLPKDWTQLSISIIETEAQKRVLSLTSDSSFTINFD